MSFQAGLRCWALISRLICYMTREHTAGWQGATSMADRFRITLGQLNPTVGDLAGNAALAREAWEAGRTAGADLVALPELFITGYNAQDLVMQRAFQLHVMTHIAKLDEDCAEGPAL